MTAARPLDWIKEIDASLSDLDEKPQFGLPAPFDVSCIEYELKTLFNRKDLVIETHVKGWTLSGELWEGLGATLLPISIEWAPIGASSFFVTDEQNLKELMAELFGSKEMALFFFDSPLIEGFYNYFSAEILHALGKQPFASPLTPRLGPEPEEIQKVLGDAPCFVIDVSLKINEKNFWGRILLSERFRKEWKSYFAHLGPQELTEEMRQKIWVDLSLEVAHSQLTLDEWKKAKTGDLVLLDHCAYDPDEHKGGVVLTLKQKPILRGRIKDGGIKITNYPVYEEVSDAMDDETFDHDDEDEEDEDLYGDLDTEDSELEDDDDDLFEDLEEDEEKEKPKKSLLKKEESVSEERPSISPEEIPIKLTVEVGRIKMTAQELMSLAPGNLLELNVSPEQGVDLVVNGKKVGRGELIRMGDVLGVRIISL